MRAGRLVPALFLCGVTPFLVPANFAEPDLSEVGLSSPLLVLPLLGAPRSPPRRGRGRGRCRGRWDVLWSLWGRPNQVGPFHAEGVSQTVLRLRSGAATTVLYPPNGVQGAPGFGGQLTHGLATQQTVEAYPLSEGFYPLLLALLEESAPILPLLLHAAFPRFSIHIGTAY